MSAFFIHAGGRSSATTSTTDLNTLKWCRVSASVQNATTVSSGGQPGSAQATSVTRIAASSGSLKRERVHSFTRSRVCRYLGRLRKDRSILDGPGIAIDLRLGSFALGSYQKHPPQTGAIRVKSRLTGPRTFTFALDHAAHAVCSPPPCGELPSPLWGAPLPLVGRGRGWGSVSGSPHHPHPGASRRPSPQGGG